MALRRGLDAMDARVAKDAVVQFDPQQPGDYFRYAEIMMVGRQMASALPACQAAFGGDPAQCARVEGGAELIFAGMTADAARSECAALGVSDLVATERDGVSIVTVLKNSIICGVQAQTGVPKLGGSWPFV